MGAARAEGASVATGYTAIDFGCANMGSPTARSKTTNRLQPSGEGGCDGRGSKSMGRALSLFTPLEYLRVECMKERGGEIDSKFVFHDDCCCSH